MAWASGTCTDFIDFLRKWRDYSAGLIDPNTDPTITTGVKVIDIQATAILTFTAAPANGDTVTIDTKTYTFQTALTNVNGNVLIGGSIAAAAQNLALAINLGVGAGTAYAAATTLHPTVTGGFGPTTTTAIAKIGGYAANSIVTTDTSANASWSSATLAGGAPVKWTILGNGAGQPALPGSGSGTDGEVYLQGPGSNASDAIIIGFKTYRNAGNAIFGIQSCGYSAFDSTLTFSTMPGRLSTPTFTALANATLNCWFYVSARRIMAVARIGTTDILMHSGFPLIYGTRNQYPYPLLISGSVMDITYNTSQNNFGQSSLPDPCVGGAYLRWVDGSWNAVQHYVNGSGTRNQSSTTTNPYSIWPQRNVTVNDGGETNTQYSEAELFTSFANTGHQLSSTEVSAYPMFPCVLHSAAQLIGQVEGLVVVPGLGLNPGDTLTVGGQVYDVFHNTWRTEQIDFYAIPRI